MKLKVSFLVFILTLSLGISSLFLSETTWVKQFFTQPSQTATPPAVFQQQGTDPCGADGGWCDPDGSGPIPGYWNCQGHGANTDPACNCNDSPKPERYLLGRVYCKVPNGPYIGIPGAVVEVTFDLSYLPEPYKRIACEQYQICGNVSPAYTAVTDSQGNYFDSGEHGFQWNIPNTGTYINQGYIRPNIKVRSLPATLPSQITNPNFRNEKPSAVNCETGAGFCHDPAYVCSQDYSSFVSCNLAGIGAITNAQFDFRYLNCYFPSSPSPSPSPKVSPSPSPKVSPSPSPSPRVSPSPSPSPRISPSPTPRTSPSPSPLITCLSLGPQPASPQPGQTLNFTCQASSQNTSINHFNFRVNQGPPIKKPAILEGDIYKATYSYTVPLSGGSFTVQCQACRSLDDSICTTWGQSQ